MIKEYEVVIAGAGPAGLMTAKTAGESGLRIALLDRKKDITWVRRTDAGVIALNEYIYGQIVTFNRRIQTLIFPVAGFSLRYEGPWNDQRYGFHFYSPGGKCFKVGDWNELKKDPVKNSRGVALSKGRLLLGILNEACSLGVNYFPDTNVTGISIINGGIILETNKGKFKGRFVVAADGVNSRIVRLLGLNKGREFYGTTRYLTWVMTGVEPPESEGIIFAITPYGTFSISQVCEPDHYHVSIISHDPQEELETLLHKFIKDDPTFSCWFSRSRLAGKPESCVVNNWQAIEKPFYKNVILVGDACWSYQFSNPLSLTAGYYLGHALTKAFIDGELNEKGISQYLEWYENSIYKPYGQLSFGGTDIGKYLTSNELDYLASLPEKPAPPTSSFGKLFHTIIETYMPLVPRIKKEHPEIIEKFMRMRNNLEKIQEERKKAGFPNR